MNQIIIFGRVRGFMKQLTTMDSSDTNYIFEANLFDSKIRNHSSFRKVKQLYRFIGLFPVKIIPKKKGTYLVMNRLCFTFGAEYIIYLENQYALSGYNPRQNRLLLQFLLRTNRLSKIVCWSNACYEKTIEFFPKIKHKIVFRYPYIPQQLGQIINNKERLNLLFIAHGSRFYSKGGLELINAFIKSTFKHNVFLTVLSHWDSLELGSQNLIQNCKSIRFVEFNLNKTEMSQLYWANDILIHPTRNDSYGLVIQEALAHGLGVIATNLYAISEMIDHGFNGLLIDPDKNSLFDDNNFANEEVWKNRELYLSNAYYSNQIEHSLKREFEMLNWEDVSKFKRNAINNYYKRFPLNDWDSGI